MNSFSTLAASVIPNPTPTVPAEAKGLLTVLDVIIVGIGMVIQLRRGEGGESIGKLGWVLAGCIIITGASGIVRAFV
jgi:hypothetical protein